jgi:hypothetical protein
VQRHGLNSPQRARRRRSRPDRAQPQRLTRAAKAEARMAVERFLPSAIAHFEPADLIGALATGIVVLDSDLCVVYANVAGPGSARRQRQPGARQTLPLAGARSGFAAAR